MRLSLLKGARAGLVQRCVAGNLGPGLTMVATFSQDCVLGYFQAELSKLGEQWTFLR